jgi:hypothetical protein
MQVLALHARPRWYRGAMVALAMTFLPSGFLASQDTPSARARPQLYWGVDVGVATLSGFLQGRQHKASAVRALLGGLIGGSGMYLGQRMVGTGAPCLRFAGLQTVAAGASIARNLGTGQSPFAVMTFPVFPLYVQYRPDATHHLSVRVSAAGVGGIVRTAHEYGVWPSWQESLLAGMPVFAVSEASLGGCPAYSPRVGCSEVVVGHHLMGAIAYSARPEHFTARNVLTHELGHAAQDIRDVVLHAVPASDFVLGSDPIGRFVARFVVLDFVLPLDVLSHAAGPPRGDPACREDTSFYECETEAMMPQLE